MTAKSRPTQILGFKVHPLANLPPLMSDTELAALAESINRDGLPESIILNHAGTTIIDGRNRDLACDKARIDPNY
jgi:ParB-like chromosome segregation protein Spo0J